MYTRDLIKVISKYAKFPAVAILGPRQSGKTTLATLAFKKHRFISFENPMERLAAETDPQKFLRKNENEHGIIIDEFQYVPQLLSYIKMDIDEKQRQGYFILTGSQNYLMNKAVTQSLAGRIGILTLFPLSLHELQRNKILPTDLNALILQGCYPRIYDQNIDAESFYASYIHTYIEQDARQLTNIGDLRTFQKFIGLCAGRIGQLLQVTELAAQCGISASTAHQWLSVLQASYQVFFLSPYFNNFNKRLIKMPKLYFFDTGLACSFLGITSSQMLENNFYKGPLFENLIISDLYKQYCHRGKRAPLYFWRDRNGSLEVDCIVDLHLTQIPLEIKSGETISADWFNTLTRWSTLAKRDAADGYIIYAGDMEQERSVGRVINWKSASNLIQKLERARIPKKK